MQTRRWARGVAIAVVCAAAVWVGPTGADEPAAPAGIDVRDREAIEDLVRQYILDHPEIIIESVKRFEQRQQAAERAHRQAALAALQDEIENSPESPVAGNPDGDVTIVEFFDYRCGYCKRVFPTIQELLRTDGGLRYVFKEFPVLGPESVVAALAALAVWSIDRDKYLAFHSSLMTSRGALSEQRIFDMAARAGLEPAQLREAMKAPGIDSELQRNIALAGRIGVRGTPAFIIGGKLVPGAIDIETMKGLIASARSS